MGVVELAVFAAVLIAGTVAGSAVAGALLGRSRDIGAVRGLAWGLLLPVLGLVAVLTSLKKKEQAADWEKEAPVSIERQPDGVKESAREAARERFRKDNPSGEATVRKTAIENTQSRNSSVVMRR